MNLYDKSSLILVPGAVKDGKVYSQRPENGSGDFTFTRASSATRVNSDGLIEKETQNLLLQSNSFDTTWGNSNSTETSGQAGYDGSSDAWLLTATSSTDAYISQSLSLNFLQTFSVYAKANTADFVELVAIGGANPRAWFNLSTGSVGTSYNVVGTNIESIGSGWYRCSIILNASITSCRIYASDSDNSTAVTIGNSIYIQDAQLNQGLVADSYLETTTTAVYGGITDNIPRLDYTDASCPSLLLEPQRTNLVPYSELINTSTYFITNSTQEEFAGTSPDGSNTATKITSTGYTIFRPFGALTLATNTTYTFSFYAKNIDATGAWFRVYNSSAANNLVNTTSYFNQLILGEWVRVEYTFTTTATDTQYYPYLQDGNQGGSILYWGVQLESGSYPKSYIPTYGASVTRVVDWCRNNSATSLIGQTEGTLFLDLNVTTIDENSFLFGIYGGGNEIYFRGLALNKIGFVHYFGGAIAYIFTTTLSEGRYKLAACYKNNDWVLYLNGSLVNTDTSGTFSGGSINNVTFGYSSIGAYPPFESVNKAILFKTRLSNEELADLTTI